MTSRTAENYLRAIYDITEKKGHARVKDIASALSVRPPTVTEMLEKLAGRKLVDYRKREGVVLTEEGRRVAIAVHQGYRTFLRLFTLAGVDPETAYRDACAVEHYISTETSAAMARLVEQVEQAGGIRRP